MGKGYSIDPHMFGRFSSITLIYMLFTLIHQRHTLRMYIFHKLFSPTNFINGDYRVHRTTNVRTQDLHWWHHWQRQMGTLYHVRWWYYLPFEILFHFLSDDITKTFYLLWINTRRLYSVHNVHPRLVAMILTFWLSRKNFFHVWQNMLPGVPIELKCMAQFNHWTYSANIHFVFQLSDANANEWIGANAKIFYWDIFFAKVRNELHSQTRSMSLDFES